MDIQKSKNAINSGETYLGIELGSTRIKAVLIDKAFSPIASGSHTWENRLENGIWTYSLDDIWTGIRDCYAQLAADVSEKYGVQLETVGAIGISAMMHGYMAFDGERQAARAVPHLAQHDYSRGGRKADGAFRVQHSAALEHSAPVSGDPERRKACSRDTLLNDACGLYPLAADGGKGARHRGRVGHVPHRRRGAAIRQANAQAV